MKFKTRKHRKPTQLQFETLESRNLLAGITPHSFAFDLIDLYDMRRIPEFQDIDGSNIGIALIDTGVDGTHELLAGNYSTSVDFVYGEAGTFFTSSHGTHVAGIAAATDPDIGVANDADIISLQVFSQSDGYASWVDILESLQWVRSNHHQHNIKVVNMSLGAGMYTSASGAATVTRDVYQEILNLERLGITVVSAAGNEYGFDRNGVNFMSENANAPGIYSTIVVGAVWESYEGGGLCLGNYVCDVTTAADRIVHYSQRPPQQDNVIFAPGAFINSSVPGNGLQEMGGTSMAAPMVSGTIALMQDAAIKYGGRYLSPEEIQQLLRSSADTIHDGDDENSVTTIDGVDFDYTNNNYARLNVLHAIEQVRQLVENASEQPDRYVPQDNDPNSTITGAYRGPNLPLHWSLFDNDPYEAVILKGILGRDARRFESGDADVDMFAFEVTAPGIVILETTPWNANRDPADTMLRLFDSSGNQLATDDDSNPNGYSHLEVALEPGSYFVGVSGSGNDIYDPHTSGTGHAADRGYYELAFSWANDDLNGFLDTAVQVSFNQGETEFQGLIGADYGTYVGTQDVDLFRIVVPDDGSIVVDIDTPYVDGYVDSFLRVFDVDGYEITYSDDDLQTTASGVPLEYTDNAYPGLVFEDPVDRQYFDGHTRDSFVLGSDLVQDQVLYFGVSGYGNGSYNPMSVDGRTNTMGGTYEVSFQFESNDLSGTMDEAMVLPESGVWYEEFIYFDWDANADDWATVSDKDIDFYAITPTASGVLELDIDSYSLTDNDDVLDSVITVFDEVGNYVAQRDWDFVTDGVWDAKIQLLATAGTTYYMAVSGMGNQTFVPSVIGDALPGDMGYYQIKWETYPQDAYNTLTDDRLGHAGILDLETGSSFSAEIGYDDAFALDAHDIDLYQFTPTADGDYMVWTTLPDEWSADTVLRLFDESGNELALNDDDPWGGLGSYLNYMFTAGNTYFFGVSGYSENGMAYDPITGHNTAAGSQGAYSIHLAHTDLPPTMDVLSDLVVDEDSESFSVALSGLSSGQGEMQPFQIQAFASNDDVLTTTLHHEPNSATATLEISIPADGFGTSAILLEMMDGGYDHDLETLMDNQYFVEEFTVAVNEINDVPVARDTVYELTENDILNPELDNDLFHLVTDPDINQLHFTIVDPPRFGQLALRHDGSFQYIPNHDFNRQDSFSFVANDGSFDSNTAHVQINMETEYEWFNGAVPGDINDDGQLVPLDALMTINYLNGGAGGILPLNRSAGLQAPFWDSNRDNHLSAIDALVVINELNKLQAGEGEGEGEAWTQQADRYWHNAGESDDTVDASVDKITVADLESNPITTFPTSPAASASAIHTLQRDDILKITGDFTSTRDDKPDESPAIFDAF